MVWINRNVQFTRNAMGCRSTSFADIHHFGRWKYTDML